MLPVSLDCPFLIAPTVYLSKKGLFLMGDENVK
jgi:hypothetical protein